MAGIDKVELESWDSWTVGDHSDKTSTAASSRYGNHRFPGKKPAAASAADADSQLEVDYFQEMCLEPAIRKTKKVIVRKKDGGGATAGGGLTSRLAMASNVPLSSGSELGTLDESEVGGWADEASEDLSIEAESALRDQRRVDRERRLVEHRQKKLERHDNSPMSAACKGRMSAVKIS